MRRAQPPRQIATGPRAARLGPWPARLGALRLWVSRLRAARPGASWLEARRLAAGRAARAAVAAAAARLYRDLILQARSPGFYRELGVPDTPEGRFEMIGLHAGLILLRLRAEGAPGQALGQALFDLMVADLDQSLRELGVGDLGVGKQARRLAGQFYARLRALDEILGGGGAGRPGGSDAGDGGRAGEPAGAAEAERLGQVLRANVWQGGRAPAAPQVAALADYLIRCARRLGDQSADRLLDGEAAFADPGGQAAFALPGGAPPRPDHRAGDRPDDRRGDRAGDRAGGRQAH